LSDGLPFPRWHVALVQHESEMQAAPASDLLAFLESDRAFEVELFTERNFGGLLEREGRFDCIVIGYNAAHKSEAVQHALQARIPTANLCVLHQRRPSNARFLESLGLGLVDLDERVEPVTLAEHLDREEEPLLNLPERPPIGVGTHARALEGGRVLCGLVRWGRAWRTVFEVEHRGRRLPVLMRTPTGVVPRAIVCTILLEHVRVADRRLLRNMLMWCTAGRPEAVVIDGPEIDGAPATQRKLHLQGVHAVTHPLRSREELDFETWPLRGTSHVVVPGGWDPTEDPDWPQDDPSNAQTWLRRGGRIVVVLPGSGLSVKHRHSDVRWAGEQWLRWFAATSPESWQSSIVAMRAVLEALAAIEAHRHVMDPDRRLRLKRATDYHDEASRLIRSRVGDLDNCDDTISTTAAVLEIDRLVGGVPLNRAAVERWLRNERRWTYMAPEERLEVARCLRLDGRELFEAAIGDLPRTMSATLVTKLREAIVACDVGPAPVERTLTTRGDSVVERELEANPLLAANYLSARLALCRHWAEQPGGESHPLVQDHLENLDSAIMTIRRDGRLLSAGAEDGASDAELICAEARALLTYFSEPDVATNAIRAHVGTLPPRLFEALVEETQDLRDENAIIPGLRGDLAEARGTIALAQRVLTRIVVVLLVLLIVSGVVFVDSGVLQVIGLFVVVAAWALVFAWLGRSGLAPQWALEFEFTPQALGRAIAGLVGGARARTREPAPPPARPEEPVGSAERGPDRGPPPSSPSGR
jgi:hypothetical protein